MRIAILTTPNQWFEKYAKYFSKELNAKLFLSHEKVKNFDIVFIISYHKIIPQEILEKNMHNIVIHESDLPQGKGWAPLFWQVLKGKNDIVFSMLEANNEMDSGNIYMKRTLKLNGYELNKEIRDKQANLTMQMCREFMINYEKYKISTPQVGKESFYPKRTPQDSRIDIDKTIKEQFNLLRIVNNEEYPAYFEINGYKYRLKIETIRV